MPSNHAENILPALCPCACDPSELEHVLLGRYSSSGGDPMDARATYFPGDRQRFAVKLIFSKDHRLKAAHAGPLLTAEELARLAGIIERDLCAPGRPRVGCRVLFAALPFDGAYRYRDEFQVLPVPPHAPQAPFLMADHPFLLEYRFPGSENSMVENLRMQRNGLQLELLLVALLAHHVHSEKHLSHQWVLSPPEEPTKRLESAFRQVGYIFDGQTAIQDGFSDLSGLRGLSCIPWVTHHGARGIRAGQTMALPDIFEPAMQSYGALPPGLQTKFLNSCYWLRHSNMVARLSASASYTALASAIEALILPERGAKVCEGCKRSMGKGPTRQFKEFLEFYAGADDRSSGALKDFYDIRSQLSHGGKVLVSDRSVVFGGTEDFEDWQRHSRLHEMVRVAMIYWLLRSAASDRQG